MAELTEKEFLQNVKDHQLQIVRDDGVYRHLLFAEPGTNNGSFELITWPGYLCYCGDMGTFVFSRLQDMFEFFRDQTDRGGLSINTGYWGKKCEAVDKCDGIRTYSPEAFRQVVKEEFEESDFYHSVEILEALENDVLSYADDGEYEARRAAENFECAGFRFHDFWERTLTVKSGRFVWCCYALAWGIQLYDQSKSEVS